MSEWLASTVCLFIRCVHAYVHLAYHDNVYAFTAYDATQIAVMP